MILGSWFFALGVRRLLVVVMGIWCFGVLVCLLLLVDFLGFPSLCGVGII